MRAPSDDSANLPRVAAAFVYKLDMPWVHHKFIFKQIILKLRERARACQSIKLNGKYLYILLLCTYKKINAHVRFFELKHFYIYPTQHRSANGTQHSSSTCTLSRLKQRSQILCVPPPRRRRAATIISCDFIWTKFNDVFH